MEIVYVVSKKGKNRYLRTINGRATLSSNDTIGAIQADHYKTVEEAIDAAKKYSKKNSKVKTEDLEILEFGIYSTFVQSIKIE